MKVANRGINGDTTRGVLIRLQDDVLALNPRRSCCSSAPTISRSRPTPETIAGNLKLMIAAVKAHNAHTPVILCQVFPSSASMERPVEEIKAVNALHLAAVKGDPQVIPLDTWTLFADEEWRADPATEFPDLLHPND